MLEDLSQESVSAKPLLLDQHTSLRYRLAPIVVYLYASSRAPPYLLPLWNSNGPPRSIALPSSAFFRFNGLWFRMVSGQRKLHFSIRSRAGHAASRNTIHDLSSRIKRGKLGRPTPSSKFGGVSGTSDEFVADCIGFRHWVSNSLSTTAEQNNPRSLKRWIG